MTDCVRLIHIAILDTHDTHDLIGHLILLLTALITVHLCFVCYFSFIPVYIILICSHVICTCTFPFILTHSSGVLTFWICTSRFMYVILLIRYLERITGILRNLKFSLFDYLYSCLTFISVDSLFSIYITFSCHFITLFICYHVWTFICTVAVLSYYHSDYIACSSYFRLSVYTWGIFLAYMRRRLSSRLRFHVFWEAGHEKISSSP